MAGLYALYSSTPAGAFRLTRTACSHRQFHWQTWSYWRPAPLSGYPYRMAVVLWHETNSAAVIQYRFPDNLSAAKMFFRIRPHILPIAIHYRLINAPFALVLPQYYLGTNHCINSFIYAKYSISHMYIHYI